MKCDCKIGVNRYYSHGGDLIRIERRRASDWWLYVNGRCIARFDRLYKAVSFTVAYEKRKGVYTEI